MRFAWSLRTRFLLATSVLAVALCGVFGFAVHQFIELLEDEMLHRSLVREMEQFKLEAGSHPQMRPLMAGGLTGFVVRSASDRSALPAPVASLSKGLHEDVLIANRRYYVAVDGGPGEQLYLLLDTERVEQLEGEVITVAVLLGVLSLGIAAIVSFSLARAVLRPVTELVDRVEHLTPGKGRVPLAERFANQEVGVIAAAFDGYMDKLERVLEREQAFTEDASHELRTPLAIISSAAQLLSEERVLSASGVERLARIQRACSQMQRLIEALLFLARGDAVASGELCELDRVVNESVDMTLSALTLPSVDVIVEVEPVVVRGATAMAACVVSNLLLNAVNFTQQGAIMVCLTRRTLTVRDTGVGIPPEDLQRIFERRYRGEQSRGLGLGLYLVSRICERLGWSIETVSREGRGTTFKIHLGASVMSPPVEEPEGDVTVR